MDAMFLSTFWKLLILQWRKKRKLRWKKQPQASWTSFVPARSPWGLWTCASSGFLPQCKGTDLKWRHITPIDCRCYYGLSFASTSLSGDAFTNFLLRCHTAIFFNSSSSSTVHAAHDASCSYVVNTHQRANQEDPDLSSLSEFASCFCLSVFIEIPSAICCILVIDCWGRRPTLTFCQVTKLLFLSDTFLQVVSGLACVVCGLLQGVQDPALQTLQVRKTRKSHNYSSFLSCACLFWESLGLPSPSSSSTCTLPSSFPPPWGTRRLESAPWLPGCSSSSPWCSWYNPQLNSDKSTCHLVVHVAHGNQDRRHHCPASRPHQSLLASCASLHHGSDRHCGE